MTEQAPLPPMSRSEMEIRELIRHFKKRKRRYLAIVLLLGTYSFYLFKFQLLEYSSTASFMVNEHSVISPMMSDGKILEDISTSNDFNRIFELINSAATQKHLIEKFHLLNHYGIDSANEFSFQKAIERIRSNISIVKSPLNTISVTVHDRYRYLAADIANEIVDFLETLNEDLYISNMQKKMHISEAYLEQIKHDNIQKSAAIDSLIRKLNLLYISAEQKNKPTFELLAQQQTLGSIVNNFQNSTNELINSEKLFNLSYQALNFKSYPTITTLRSAMPAPRSIALTSLFLSIGIMVLTFLGLILQAYLYLHYKTYIHMILHEK